MAFKEDFAGPLEEAGAFERSASFSRAVLTFLVFSPSFFLFAF